MEAMLQQLLTCQANFQEQYYGKQKNASELQQNIRETIAAIKNPVKSTSTKTTTPDVSSQFQQILQDKGIWPLLQQIDGTCPLRQFIELVEEYLHAPESIPVFRQAYSAMLKHEFLREVELFAQRIESELLRAHILCGKQALERKQIPYKDVLSTPFDITQNLGPKSAYFAIGDIHGDVEILIKAIKHLQTISPENPAMNRAYTLRPDIALVFLGDYVDRGQYPLEVIITILKLAKINSHVFLCRGNHECMTVNMSPTFGSLNMFDQEIMNTLEEFYTYLAHAVQLGTIDERNITYYGANNHGGLPCVFEQEELFSQNTLPPQKDHRPERTYAPLQTTPTSPSEENCVNGLLFNDYQDNPSAPTVKNVKRESEKYIIASHKQAEEYFIKSGAMDLIVHGHNHQQSGTRTSPYIFTSCLSNGDWRSLKSSFIHVKLAEHCLDMYVFDPSQNSFLKQEHTLFNKTAELQAPENEKFNEYLNKYEQTSDPTTSTTRPITSSNEPKS